MAMIIKQATSIDVAVGPFLDEGDGKTIENTLTITQPDVRLKKNGGAWAQKAAAQTLSHEEAGWYEVTLDATDTDTVGQLIVAIHESGALPVWREFQVVEEAIYDAFYAASATGLIPVNVTQWLGQAVAAVTVNGVPEVDITHIGGTAVTAAAGIPEVKVASIAAGAVTAAAIADNAIDAATFAADVDAEILSYIVDDATKIDASDLNTEIDALKNGGRLDLLIDAILEDTGTTLQAEVDGIQADTEDIQARIPAALGANGNIKADVRDWIGTAAATPTVAGVPEVDVTHYGGSAGTAFSGIPSVNMITIEGFDATETINAEAESAAASVVDDYIGAGGVNLTAITSYLDGLIVAKGTIGATGNDTTHVHVTGLSFGDDELNDMLLVIRDVSAGEWHSRWISDYAGATDLATVATLPFTPENSVDLFVVTAVRRDVTGGSGPSAADIADAVWLETLADHSGSAGSTAEALNAAGSAGDPWVTALPGAYGSGSAGKIIGDNINATISSRASQTSVDDIPTNAELATSQAAADDATLAAIAALNNLSAAQVNAEVDTALADYDGPTNAEMVARTLAAASYATAAALATAQTSIDDIPTNAELATSQAAADDATLAAIAALTIPTAAAVADAVWDEDATAHQTQGTFGQAIGDPGADTDTLFGLVNTNLNTTVSSRASQTSVDDLPTNAELNTALAAADDAILAAIAALNNLSLAQVSTAIASGDDATLAAIAALSIPTATENADALLKRDMAAVTGEASRSLLNALRAIRNKVSISAGTMTITKEDDTTAAWTAAVTTAAGNPITGIDPV